MAQGGGKKDPPQGNNSRYRVSEVKGIGKKKTEGGERRKKGRSGGHKANHRVDGLGNKPGWLGWGLHLRGGGVKKKGEGGEGGKARQHPKMRILRKTHNN